MNGSELTTKLKKLAKARGVRFEIDLAQGKGSHRTIHFGNQRTTLKDPRKEIGPGLLIAMLRQLGLTRKDLK